MRTKQFYIAIILGAAMFCGGAFAQGKGGGKHGGGNGNGKGRGGEMRVERGNDKGNWRGDDADRGRGNGNWKNRGGDRDFRQERQPQVDWNTRRQQQQNEWNARRQQQINDWNAQRRRQIDNERGRRQQDVNEWNARRQRQIIDDNERFARQSDKHNRKKDKRSDKWNERNDDIFGDRGGFPIFSYRDKSRKHRKHDRDDRDERFDRGGLWQGWDNFPRGNAYGRRGIWPGEFRGWRDPDKQARKLDKRDRKRGEYRDYYYYRDDRDRIFNVWDDRDYDRDDYYDDRYSRDDRDFARENFFRSILSNFFGGGFDNGYDRYPTNYYPQQSYVSYAPASPAYYGYQPSYYSPVSYPLYNDGYYGNDTYYGDPYNNSSPFLSGIFGGGDSGWFGIVGQLLSGLLGQGYLQGLNDGEYAQYNDLGRDAYYNPYSYEDANYVSYAGSLDQQRSLLSQGYELGYRDALHNRDQFQTQNLGGLDILSAFLGNGLRYN